MIKNRSNEPEDDDEEMAITALLSVLQFSTQSLINFQQKIIRAQENKDVILDLEDRNTELDLIELAFKDFLLNMTAKPNTKIAYDYVQKITNVSLETIQQYKEWLEQKKFEKNLGEFFNLDKFKPPEL